MKIHSNTLTPELFGEILRATKAAGKMARSVYYDTLRITPSSSRVNAYDVVLASNSWATPTAGRCRQWLSEGKWTATGEEWKWLLAGVFARDPDAKVGPFTDSAAFERLTQGKYSSTDNREAAVR